MKNLQQKIIQGITPLSEGYPVFMGAEHLFIDNDVEVSLENTGLLEVDVLSKLSDAIALGSHLKEEAHNEDVANLFTTQAFQKSSPIQQESQDSKQDSADDSKQSHIANHSLEVLSAVKEGRELAPDDYSFTGFTRANRLIRDFVFKPTSLNKDLVAKQSGLNDSSLEELTSLIQEFYKNDKEMLFDNFFTLSQGEKDLLMEKASQLKDKNILINGAFELGFWKAFVEALSEHNDVTVKTNTKLTCKLSEQWFDDNVKIIKPEESLPKKIYEFSVLVPSINDSIQAKDKDLNNSFLREDEYQWIQSFNAMIESGEAISIVPSEIISEKRQVFLDRFNQSIDLKHIAVRMPLSSDDTSRDVIISGSAGQSLSQNHLLTVTGEKLQNIEAKEVTAFTEINQNQYLQYKIPAYTDDSVDTHSLINALRHAESELSDLISTNDETKGSHQYIEDTFYDLGEGEVGLYQYGKMNPLSGVNKKRASAFISLKEAFQSTLSVQKSTTDEAEIKHSLQELKEVYEQFKKDFGALNLRKNERPLSIDPLFNNLSILERPVTNEEGNVEYVASDFFESSVFSPVEKPTEPVELALYYFEQYGFFDFEKLEPETGLSKNALTELLISEGIAYLDGNTLTHRDVYLSGDVGEKLNQAIELSKEDNRYSHNVTALKSVIPKNIDFKDIYFEMGSYWLHERMINDFLSEEIGEKVQVQKNLINQAWSIHPDSIKALNQSVAFKAKYSASEKNAETVLLTALNQLTTVIKDKQGVNIDATEDFKNRVEQIKADFKEFVSDTPQYRLQIEEDYNRLFNAYKKTDFTARFSTIEGMNKGISLRPHQISNAQKSIHFGSSLYAHDAGSGKTFTQVTSAMLQSRIYQSPTLMAVPNHMPRQMMREALELFPEARILYLDNAILKDHDNLMRKVNSLDYDIFIVKHDSLNRYLTVPTRFAETQLNKQKHEMISMLDYFEGDRRVQSDLESGINRINKSLQKIKSNAKLSIEELGVKAIVVDEAHNFKNLGIPEPTGNMLEQISGSDRADSLKLMIEYIHQLHKDGMDKAVVFATGTPVSNSLLEIFNLQKYLQPSLIKKLGLHSIKNWSDTFLDISIQYEPDEAGQNMVAKSRYTLKNIPELISILSNVMSVVTLEDAGIKVPDSQVIYENCDLNEEQKGVLADLILRLDAVKKKSVPPKIDNKLKIISDSRKMALSPGLIKDENGFSLPNISPKLEKVCENVFSEYQKSESILGTQLVFCDLGTPAGFAKGESVYDIIKNNLIEKGMPTEQIAFIHDPKNDKEKEMLFESVREGHVRVLIGSTAKMGEGTNVQKRLVASHDVDPPWRPKDIIQRRRRTVRQGNMNEEVRLYVYTTKNSFDSYAWSKLDGKNKAFSYIMSGKAVSRSFELDLDPSFAETYAIVSGREELIEASKLETQLITVNAQKKGLEKRYDTLNSQIKLNQEGLSNNAKNIIKAQKIVESETLEKGWSVNGAPSTRQDVLKNRKEAIFYNGAQVTYSQSEKQWSIGGFDFKRPVDIEKQFTLSKNELIDESNEAIEYLRSSIEALKVEISEINLNQFYEEIKRLNQEHESLMCQIHGTQDSVVELEMNV